LLQLLAGGLARVVAGVGLLHAAFSALTAISKRLGGNGERLLENQRGFAMWSPVASNALLQYDLHKMRLEFERASSQGVSIAVLARAQTRFDESLHRFLDPLQRVGNYGQAGVSNLAASALDLAAYTPAYMVLKDIADHLEYWFPLLNANTSGNPIEELLSGQQKFFPIPKAPKLDANKRGEI